VSKKEFSCSSVECEKDAIFACSWPGQDVKFCWDCAARARHLARVMGFDLVCLDLKPLKASLAARELANDDEDNDGRCLGCGEDHCAGQCAVSW
jgi:hypothetical protein